MSPFDHFSPNDFSAISVSEIGEKDLERLEKETFAPASFARKSYFSDEDESAGISTNQLDALRSSLSICSPPKEAEMRPSARLLSPPESNGKDAQKVSDFHESKDIFNAQNFLKTPGNFHYSNQTSNDKNSRHQLIDQLKLECESLREINQKLIEAMNENNKLISQLKQSNALRKSGDRHTSDGIETFYKHEIDRIQKELNDLLQTNIASDDAKNREIATLKIKVKKLEAENSNIKNSPFFRSPLAPLSADAGSELWRKNGFDPLKNASTSKYVTDAEWEKEKEKLKEKYDKDISSIKSAFEAQICKQELEVNRLKEESENGQNTIKSLQNDLQATKEKAAKNETERFAKIQQNHQQELNFVIQKYSSAKEQEIASLKQKFKHDLHSLSTKFKKQTESIVENVKKDLEEKHLSTISAYKSEIEQLKNDLSEKDSLFVNAIIPSPSKPSKTLQTEIDQLKSENHALKQDLQSQKAAIIEKLKKKFKEHIFNLRSTFDFEKQKTELNFQKILAEKLKYLHSKYKLK